MPFTPPELHESSLGSTGRWTRWLAVTLVAALFVALLGAAKVLPVQRALQLAAVIVAGSALWRLIRLMRHEHRLVGAFAINAERLRRTIDDAPIGMALVGLDGRWLRINAAL